MSNTLGLTPTMTIQGNNATEKLFGSIAEVQIKKILTNAMANEFLFRSTATAQSIQQMAGIATAVYRIAKRSTWGVQYDLNTGAPRRQLKGGWATIQLDKTMNIKVEFEDYDVDRFLSGDKNVIISEWLTSIITNLYQNMELVFRRAVADYCIARSASDSEAIMVQDFSKISTEDEAKTFFTDFGLKLNKKITKIDDTMIGTNPSDWLAVLSLNSFTYLTKAFTGLVGGDIAAQTLVSGELYANSIFGLPITKDFWLEGKYTKDTETQMNYDVSFDLSKVLGIVVHKDAWAFPQAFNYFKQLINPETGNIMWVGKYLAALPSNLRPELCFIITATTPTAAEQTAAIAKAKLGTESGGGNEFDWETYTFQIAEYDTVMKTLYTNQSNGGGTGSDGGDDSGAKAALVEMKKLAEQAKEEARQNAELVKKLQQQNEALQAAKAEQAKEEAKAEVSNTKK